MRDGAVFVHVDAWHHAKHPGRVANFANVAPWCDLLFGSYHCPKAEVRFELGLPEPIPLGYFQLLFGIFPSKG